MISPRINPKNIICNWLMRDNAKDSIHEYDGEWYGNEDYDYNIFGKKAGKFDESSAITFEHKENEMVDGQEQMTISLWYRLNIPLASHTASFLYLLSTNGTGPFILWLDKSNNRIQCYFSALEESYTLNIPDPPDNKKTNHIVFTYKPRDYAVAYLNQKYITSLSTDNSTGLKSGSTKVWMGGYPGSGFYINGLIWNALILKKSITYDEIIDLSKYNQIH